MEIRVPPVVRQKALAVGAGSWLTGLSGLVADLLAEWDLELVDALDGGTEAWVGGVITGSGAPAVLKLVVPRQRWAESEIAMLAAIDGDGCARLLRSDAERSALLVERLGEPLSDSGLPAVARQRILCDLARRIWRPVPQDLRDVGPIMDGREKARSLAVYVEEIWESTGRPVPRGVVDQALVCAEHREAAWDPRAAVLVHGDVHAWNALRRGDGWALIDPDGIEIEPEYDLGILMREDPLELLEEGAWHRAERLAAWTGLDTRAIWEWGVVERVSTGLLARSIGLEPIGTRMLEAAERIARDPAL